MLSRRTAPAPLKFSSTAGAWKRPTRPRSRARSRSRSTPGALPRALSQNPHLFRRCRDRRAAHSLVRLPRGLLAVGAAIADELAAGASASRRLAALAALVATEGAHAHVVLVVCSVDALGRHQVWRAELHGRGCRLVLCSALGEAKRLQAGKGFGRACGNAMRWLAACAKVLKVASAHLDAVPHRIVLTALDAAPQPQDADAPLQDYISRLAKWRCQVASST